MSEMGVVGWVSDFFNRFGFSGERLTGTNIFKASGVRVKGLA